MLAKQGTLISIAFVLFWRLAPVGRPLILTREAVVEATPAAGAEATPAAGRRRRGR